MTHFSCKYCNEDLDNHTKEQLEICNMKATLAIKGGD